MTVLLLLSGPIACGKSAITSELTTQHGFRSVGTGKYLAKLSKDRGIESTRLTLQDLGDELDIQTSYQWPVSVAAVAIEANPAVDCWLLDSVRKKQQVENFRNRFSFKVLHVHITASDVVLQARYESRAASAGVNLPVTPYAQAIDHPNEVAARSLCSMADLICDTSKLSVAQVVDKILDLMNKE